MWWWRRSGKSVRKLLLTACCAWSITGQQPAFESHARLVQIPVTATDSQGRNLDGLAARDFALRDDGESRAFTLDSFGSGAAPISLVIAVQASGADKAQRAGSLIQPLVTGHRGEAAVLTFDSRIDWLLEFTSRAPEIQHVLSGLEKGTGKQARILDAVAAAALRLRERSGRRILLLISEARDRGSRARLSDVLETIGREGVEVFAATYPSYASATAARSEPPAVQTLAENTGGSVYSFIRQRAFEKAIETFGAEVHSQYILSFAPSNVRKGMHTLEVLTPNRRDARIRSRRAYWTD